MLKLMYSETGGFHYFLDGKAPAGWVDGEPIRKALLDAKSKTDTLNEEALQYPLDAPTRRRGRPPKNIVENDLGNSTDTD